MAATTQHTCTVCLDDFDKGGMSIYGDKVCEDCIRTGIVPKFHEALKFEHCYPPTFGNKILRPQDFARFLDDSTDYDEFIRDWQAKKTEYETPYKARVHCAACGVFACRTPRDGSKVNVRCTKCYAMTCRSCGKDVTASVTLHVCGNAHGEGEEEDDRLTGLQRGLDYQICPNEKCQAVYQLRDGCNAMRCTSAGCQTDFCFICGQVAAHNSTHWTQAGGCPRWNQPGSDRAHFDGPPAPVAPATAADIIRGLAEGEDPRRFMGPMVRRLPALPPVPGVADEHPAGRRLPQLLAEQQMQGQLLETEFGILMTHMQGAVGAMLQVAQAEFIDLEAEGKTAPVFLEAAVDVMLKLFINLDMLVWRQRFAASSADYQRRHDEIHRLIGMHGVAVLDRFPMLEAIIYLGCVVIHMLEA